MDPDVTVTRDIALDVLATVEALATVARRHIDDLSVGEAEILLGADDVAADMIAALWGDYGSGPDRRL
jgi:hypothetical protein